MSRLPRLGFAAVFALLLALFADEIPAAESNEFAVELEAIRERNHVPALAAAAVQDGVITDIAAVGQRSVDDDAQVTVDDQWHLGSITKSMTATVAAMLVQKGRLRWDATVAEVLGKVFDTIDEDWTHVTVEELLSHRGGAPAEPPEAAWRKARRRIGTPAEQRLEFVGAVLARPTELPPRTKSLYSNQGYAIVGEMMEQVTGQPWEELMQTMLFTPLQMGSAGFGPPGTAGRLDQPLGHFGGNKDPNPIPPGNNADLPPAIAPAGTVHCSVRDLAKYAAFHASRGATAPGLLKEESFEKLHSRVPHEDYALGWCVLRRRWAGGDALMHTGSNALWYAAVWVAPEQNLGFVAVTNIDSENADDTCDQAIKALLKRVTDDDQ